MSGRGRPQAPADQKNAQFVDDALARKFDTVVEALGKHHNLEKDTLCTSEACAKLIAQIQIFMDQKLGHKSKIEERFMTKIPAAFFRDFKESGSLEYILKTALEFRQQMQAIDGSVLRRFELLSEKQKTYARDLCHRLSDGLKAEGYWKVPVIYLWDNIPSDLATKLRHVALSHGGGVTDDIKSATHIILHRTARDSHDNEIYTREIGKEGHRSFAHWWYYPDSWDCWTSALGTLEQEWEAAEIPPDGKWKVGYDWLLDMEYFNEWMCELDYEIFDFPPLLLEHLTPISGSLHAPPSSAVSKSGKLSRKKVKDAMIVPPYAQTASLEAAEDAYAADKMPMTSDLTLPSASVAALFPPNPSSASSFSEVSGKPTLEPIDANSGSHGSEVTVGGVVDDSREAFDVSVMGDASVTVDTRQPATIASRLTNKKRSMNEVQPTLNSEAPQVIESENDKFVKRLRYAPDVAVAANVDAAEVIATGELGTTDSLRSVSESDNDLNLLSSMEIKPKPPIAAVGAVPLVGGGISVAALPDPQSMVAFNTKANAVAPVAEDPHPFESNAEGEFEEKREDSTFVNTSTMDKGEEDTSSIMSSSAAPFAADVSKKGSLTLSGESGPQEIAPDVVKHAPLENLLYSSSLLSKERTTLLNVGNLEEQYAVNFPNQMSLKSIPLGTLPDRPPPNGIEDAVVQNDATAAKEASALPEATPPSNWDGSLLPTCSQWFDLNSVHRIEKEQLAALFMGTNLSTTEKENSYKHIRNTIVMAYRKNHEHYLSATECRKIIDGDAALIIRLHSFLDYWGIINFQADPATIPGVSLKGKDFTLSDAMVFGGTTTKSGATVAAALHPTQNRSSSAGGMGLFDMSKLADVGGRNLRLATEPPYKGGGPWKCASCGKLCLYSYYVIRPGGTTGISLGVLDKCVWCLKCYAEGQYPSVLTEKQFLKVDIPIVDTSAVDGNWTPQELAKLIEGIELYKEDWEAVAKHVGTGKTPHQCVSFFISIPIAEPFLDSSEALNHQEIPFINMSNPLLAQLAFLTSVVNPTVAAAAAKAALDSLITAQSPQQEDSQGSSGKDSGTAEQQTVSFESGQASVSTSADPTSAAIPQDEGKATNAEHRREGTPLPLSQKYGDASSRDAPPGYVTEADLKVACTVAVAAAAVRAQELANIEEDQVRKLLPKLIDLQLQKLDVKKQRFKLFEEQVVKESSALEEKFGALMSEWNEMKNYMQGYATKRQIYGLNNDDGIVIRGGAGYDAVDS